MALGGKIVQTQLTQRVLQTETEIEMGIFIKIISPIPTLVLKFIFHKEVVLLLAKLFDNYTFPESDFIPTKKENESWLYK